MNDLIAEKYESLLGHKPEPDVIDRLNKIAKVIGVSDSDALWGILLGLEYYDRLFEDHPKRLHEAVITLQKRTPIQGWMWISLALGGVVSLGVICFLAGIAVGGGDMPAWLGSNNGFGAAITAILRIPAGWILILACFPWAAYYLIDLIIKPEKKLLSDQKTKKFWTSKPFAITLLIAYSLVALKICFIVIGM